MAPAATIVPLTVTDRHRVDDASEAVRDGGDLGARQGRANLGRVCEDEVDRMIMRKEMSQPDYPGPTDVRRKVVLGCL